jgi:hypothetical protein
MADERTPRRVAGALAAARRRVWERLAARPGGFPWLRVAGRAMTGVVVIDIDATIILAHCEKDGAAPTFKHTYGFHPLIARCGNTGENLSLLLRAGNAGSNTVADHLAALRAAIAQFPPAYRRHLLVRVDGAGATHALLGHLVALNSTRRTVEFSVGWFIDAATEAVIAALLESAWERSYLQSGDLTDYERATGWHCAVFATTAGPGIRAQWLDARHRAHAHVEGGRRKTGSRTTKQSGCAPCRERTGRSTTAGPPPPSPRTCRPAPGCSACTTVTSWPTPHPTLCATGSCTCPPA